MRRTIGDIKNTVENDGQLHEFLKWSSNFIDLKNEDRCAENVSGRSHELKESV